MIWRYGIRVRRGELHRQSVSRPMVLLGWLSFQQVTEVEPLGVLDISPNLPNLVSSYSAMDAPNH